ncbi:hypothetical protein CDL15_Pgr016367 [Punica granatum]|uniref:Uncharacterized protein n=1 Tax=Punica granatum TaxID=22663 RepID=A0A218W5M7_PUNGR|nr:hypothetical protein CDL15_Pgr016367 [Punica granatum]
MESPRHSCLKLELPNPTEPDKIEPIFIKATWYDIHFDFSITNGIDLWVCKGFQQPGSVYKFTDVGNGQRRFLIVLNSKKGELRELREQLVKAGGNGGKSPEEEESTEKTDPFDEGSDSEVENVKSGTGTSEDVQKGKSRGRKRIALK